MRKTRVPLHVTLQTGYMRAVSIYMRRAARTCVLEFTIVNMLLR
jgi:hypothetical protein